MIRQNLPFAEQGGTLVEVAAALDCAHTRTDEAGLPLGIVNRDVNPGHIRLGPRGEVRMTDFGVALSRLTGRVATSFPRPQGEVLYVAPEALMGDAVDARADLFSLGLTLLEFVTGRHLYDALGACSFRIQSACRTRRV
ncbi:protein kinase domain-containing protein [Corallococcus sp. bb12-1]|uniref:protein kinase domain-containing protein n=1 Tax=Corallococcus sp. bb12-1 TaxID=2996784 RepID=UPI002D1E3FC4|nr:protein kinase [Corallococcus sp. bb12-1]